MSQGITRDDLDKWGDRFKDSLGELLTEKLAAEELQAAKLPAKKADRIAKVKQEAGNRILAAFPQFKQNNASLGLYDEAKTQVIRDGINAIRSASDAAEMAVNALTSVEDVTAFTW